MNSEEEYSESNTIFGTFLKPMPRSVAKIPGSDAGAIFGFRGEYHVRNLPWFLNANNATR